MPTFDCMHHSISYCMVCIAASPFFFF
jgi:hypothetical protein